MSRSNELHPISTAPVQVFYDPFINNHPRVHLLHRYDSATLTYLLITPPPRGVRSLVMRLSLFLRKHISGTTCPMFANFFAHVTYAVARRSSSGDVAVRYALPVLWIYYVA